MKFAGWPGRGRRRVAVLLCAGAVVLAAPLAVVRASGTTTRTPHAMPSVVIAAAGDVSCDPRDADFGGQVSVRRCQDGAVSNLLLREDPANVLALGDIQYKSGVSSAFAKSYGETWGRLLAKTLPAPGNHDYGTPDASGYFNYFGKRAGVRDEGWYSTDIGAWHIVALNSECTNVGGCGAGSEQLEWLEDDLTAHPSQCTLAFWHRPKFSSGVHGAHATFDKFWKVLYEHDADVVLNGHDHDYERFAPQTPAGQRDLQHGIREFVVGTGGESQYKFHDVLPNSEVRHTGTFGALFLTLKSDSYSWQFKAAAGPPFSDSGSGRCH